MLGVEVAHRKSNSSWKEVLQSLRQRGLHGVEFVVSDDHAGLRRAIREVLAKWSKRYSKLCWWVGENIEETLSFYRLPRQHHKHLKSTNMLERRMEEIKRRTLVVRIFPNVAACLRLIRALAAEMHENWIEATRYLNMEPPAEQKKEALRRLGEAA